MSLNPLKPRFLLPLSLLLLLCPSYSTLSFASCWIISTASLFSNYGTIFIPFFTPFPSLSLCLFFPLFLSVLRRFSLNCFRCLRYLAPLFRLYLPPPPVIHLFLFCFFFLAFFPFFRRSLMSVKTIFASCFFRGWLFILGVKRIEKASFKWLFQYAGGRGGWRRWAEETATCWFQAGNEEAQKVNILHVCCALYK